MDEQTTLVLSLQLLALFSIAGALLLYLLCKIRAGNGESCGTMPGAGGKAILVTCCDNAAGLQIALHLANKGFRVFAGIKDTSEDSVTRKVIRAWQKLRESENGSVTLGSLLSLPVDVTREDLLREAVDLIRAHLPAGEDGIWAVINTSGVSYRGRLEQQDIAHWDTILKTNVIGLLRTTRAFQCLLRNTKGRLLNFGQHINASAGLVAYTASKYAVEGASDALRQELASNGIKVVNLRIESMEPEILYTLPKLNRKEECLQEVSVEIEYQPTVLTQNSLDILDLALTAGSPKNSYVLSPKSSFIHSLDFFSKN